MRRIDLFGLAALYVAGFVLVGCSKPSAQAPADDPTPVAIATDDKKTEQLPPPRVDTPSAPAESSGTPTGLSKQEQYDAALLEALNLAADRKYADALLKMADAKAIDDTEQIRQEIDKLKNRINQQTVAEQTTQDIKTVLADGKPEDAARLAATGLQQFGGDNADQLANLKRQADALAAAANDNKDARRRALRDEGDAAMKDKNLRAAAIAYEQVLLLGDDADVKKQLDDVQAALARYDENRQRAAELRRDPANLEDAVAALQEAQKAWDTLQVRSDIDDYTLALHMRRDRLSVADFEVLGDVGIPAPGRAMAEELLPNFKKRYDLVERAQLAKVIEELKLESGDLAGNDKSRQEVGRLAKVRYLVLGSITPMNGITVNARLVDAQSGLVVQTAKLIAPTPDKLMQRLPDLAAMLQMSDKEKMDYEEQLAKQAADDIKPVNIAAALPAPPAAPAAEEPPPPPLVPFAPRPSDFGGLKFQDFAGLPAPPPLGQAFPAPAFAITAEELAFREKMLQVAIELGDNNFRRGRFRDAQFHFNLALNLFPDRRDVRVRLDLANGFLPPPVVVPVDTRPIFVNAPRLAVLNFLVFTDPAVFSPAYSPWLADNIAPYFSPPFEIVDRGYVFWYMRRIGMTYADLLNNPFARRWLGRALNIRYFVFGTVRQLDDGIEVATYMMDAEWGFVRGTGVVRVGVGLAIQGGLDRDGGDQVAARDGFQLAQAVVPVINPFELRLRLAELARQTLLDPRERVVFVRNNDAVQKLLIEARIRTRRGDFALALGLYRQALELQPDNIGVQYLIQTSNAQVLRLEFDTHRRERFQQWQPNWAAAQQQQAALAREAAGLRVVVAQQAAALDDPQRRLREAEREAAYNRLIAQALAAQKQNNINVSVQILQSAVALKPNDDGFRQLAVARAKADALTRTNAAEALAQRERDLRLKREKELALVRDQLAEERRKHEADEKTRLAALKERDDATYKRLLDSAGAATAKDNFDEAVSSLQAARTLRNTDEVNRLLNTALVGQAKATAAKKGEAAKAELEKQLADEKLKREAAEAEAKKNGELYTQALKLAQDAMAQKKYAVAVAKYQEAEKIYKTDAVLTGLHAAQDAQAKERKDADAAFANQVTAQKRAADLKNFMTMGQTALDAKKYEEAIRAFTEAKNLAPDNVDALAGLSKAQHARESALVIDKKKDPEPPKTNKLKETLDQGRLALSKKDFTAAGKALDAASQLAPTDPDVLKFKKDLQTARDTSADADALKKKQAQYEALLKSGRDALTAKKYDDAITAFTDAGKLLPNEKDAVALLKQAQQAKADALAAADKKLEEQKLRDEIKQLVGSAHTAIKAGKFDDAARSLADARKLDPKDPTVLAASKDLEDARASSANDALKKQREADYQKALKSGRDALTAKKYDRAIQAFTDAGKLMPGDKDAAALLKQAQQGKADALAAADSDAKKKEEEKKNKAEFNRLMDQGQQQMTNKKYADAVKTFTDALKIYPDDTNAKAWLKKAKDGKP
jgi:tetratricopeptide (TPR) repeat protein/TolB-like protein